jgi:hypothetical protein
MLGRKMSLGSIFGARRRLVRTALLWLRAALLWLRARLARWGEEPLAAAERRAFHAELASASTERIQGFAWLLFAVHVLLLGRDLTVHSAGLSANERSWASWLFGLHALMVLGSGATLLLLARLRQGVSRARVAFAFLGFLLVWAGAVSGADQLIGAGITAYAIVSLCAALFVTFERGPTAQAFALGLLAFVTGQLWFSPRAALAFSQLVNGGAFTLTCVLFSRMLYATKARDFAQRGTIARQHAELEGRSARARRRCCFRCCRRASRSGCGAARARLRIRTARSRFYSPTWPASPTWRRSCRRRRWWRS